MRGLDEDRVEDVPNPQTTAAPVPSGVQVPPVAPPDPEPPGEPDSGCVHRRQAFVDALPDDAYHNTWGGLTRVEDDGSEVREGTRHTVN